ncbi:MAG: hypothetical protein FWD89_02985 [Firmicutes bacterium]|nr:hypothetical protein [Bacillota bacterium]
MEKRGATITNIEKKSTSERVDYYANKSPEEIKRILLSTQRARAELKREIADKKAKK